MVSEVKYLSDERYTENKDIADIVQDSMDCVKNEINFYSSEVQNNISGSKKEADVLYEFLRDEKVVVGYGNKHKRKIKLHHLRKPDSEKFMHQAMNGKSFLIINEEQIRKARPSSNGELSVYNGLILERVIGVRYEKIVSVDCNRFIVPSKEEGKPEELEIQELVTAVALATRASIRETCSTTGSAEKLSLLQRKDRIVGVNLMNFTNTMRIIGWEKDKQNQLLSMLRRVTLDESTKYCHVLRIPTPLLSSVVYEDVDDQLPLEEQFDAVLQLQEYYANHAVEKTIYVGQHEWDRTYAIIEASWDNILCVSLKERE